MQCSQMLMSSQYSFTTTCCRSCTSSCSSDCNAGAEGSGCQAKLRFTGFVTRKPAETCIWARCLWPPWLEQNHPPASSPYGAQTHLHLFAVNVAFTGMNVLGCRGAQHTTGFGWPTTSPKTRNAIGMWG